MEKIGDMFSIVIGSCLKKEVPDREICLEKCIDTYRNMVEKEFKIEIILGFDKTEKDLPSKKILDKVDKVFFHDSGLGGSFNKGIELANYDIIVQTEDDWEFDNGHPDLCFERFKSAYKIISEYDKDAFVRMDLIPEANYTELGMEKITYSDIDFWKLNKPSKETVESSGLYFYYYSNRPQMKRKDFHTKRDIPYLEYCKVPEVEIDMCYKFIKVRDFEVYSCHRAYGHNGGDASVRDH